MRTVASSPETLWRARTGASRCGTPGTRGSAPKARSRGGTSACGGTAEQIGGFYLIDVPDDRAAQEAAQCLPRQYTVAVRPSIEIEGYERSDPPVDVASG